MKKVIVTLALSVLGMGQASACNFSWHHYGEEAVRKIVAKDIGAHVSDQYCAKFNAKNELFIEFSSYVLRDMVAGHAVVGIRPRNSTAHPVETFSMLSTDTALRTSGDAQRQAARATIKALDNLMSELDNYKIAE